MGDIVERLRSEAVIKGGSSLNLGCAYCGLECNLVDDAADEIERLRAALREIADVGSPSQPDAALIRLRNVAREALDD